MILDIVCALVALSAFYNGFTKGIIYSILSLFAIVLGVIMAMNFSTMAAVWLHNNFNIPAVIMPILSFILVLLAVVGAVKLVAYLSEKFLKVVMLNFLNKIAGGVLWTIMAMLILSILVYFIDKAGVFTENLVQNSLCYKYIMPLGPISLEWLQVVIPYLKESFQMLNDTVKEIVPAN